MSKRRELIPNTTVPKVVRGKKKVTDTPSVSKAQMPKTADFQAFLKSVETANFDTQFPRFADYTDFRFELPISRSLDAELTISSEEYNDGWSGISDILGVLWDKYLGNKFQSQMLANFVFSLLLSGVEKGWTAIINYVKVQLGEEAAKDTGAVVDGLNLLFTAGGYDKIVNGIMKMRNELNAPVTTATTSVKPNFWQKILRGIKIALSFLTAKK